MEPNKWHALVTNDDSPFGILNKLYLTYITVKFASASIPTSYTGNSNWLYFLLQFHLQHDQIIKPLVFPLFCIAADVKLFK